MGYCKDHGIFSLYCRSCDTEVLGVETKAIDFKNCEEYITGVAMIYNGQMYSLPAPNRHHHLIHKIYMDSNCEDKMIAGVQGFITNKGRFVDRKEGLEIAMTTKQLKTGEPIYSELFSENLW